MKDIDYFDAFAHLGRSKAQMGHLLTCLATIGRCGNFTWNKFEYKTESITSYENGLQSVRSHLEHTDTERIIAWLYYLKIFLNKDRETYLGLIEERGGRGQDVQRANLEYPRTNQSNLALLSGVSETNMQKSLQALEIIFLIRRTASLAPAPRFAELTDEGEAVVRASLIGAVTHAKRAVSLFETTPEIHSIDEGDPVVGIARLASTFDPSK